MDSPAAPLPLLGLSRLSDVRAARQDAAAPQLDEAARTPLQATLAEMAAEVLGLARVGIHDNFFELGGNSLSGTQVVARVREVLGVELPLVELFETPTVAALADRVEAALRQGAPALPVIPLAPRGAPLPLSFTQERLWFIHQLEPTSSAYHTLLPLRLLGELNLPAFERALAACVQRHEALRTTFPLVDGQPRQVIAPDGLPDLTAVDLRAEPAATREATARALAEAEIQRPFDLSAGSLLRTTLFQLGERDHLWLTVMHHIISDAWSLAVLMKDVAALYGAEVNGASPQLPALTHQPADFAVWQRTRLVEIDDELTYWRKQLAGLAVLDVPTDHPRPARQTFRGARVVASLPPELGADLHTLAQRAGVTQSMVVLAAFATLLYRYTGQEDLPIGLSVANRAYLASEGLISAFVNTLALRADLSAAPSFDELLARVRATALAAYAHQTMPFAQLVAELNPARRMDQSPLVQVMFNFINVPAPTLTLPGLEASGTLVEPGGAQFDLSLMTTEMSAMSRLLLEYNTDLFERATAQRMVDHLVNLLAAAVADPTAPVTTLPLLSPAERATLLTTWNDTAAYSAATIPALFAAQAARTPNAHALRFGAEMRSYRQLAAEAEVMAHRLHALGVGAGSIVGVSAGHSPALVAALLGTLQLGAAYVPLDPAYPLERLKWMATEARANVIVTEAARAGLWGSQPAPLLLLDGRDAAPTNGRRLPDPALSPDTPAYLLFTSGSTGQPKAVVAPHRGLVNRCQWQWAAYPYQPGEVALHKTALNFVDAAAEIFAPLLAGVPLVLAPEAALLDPEQFVALLAAERVSRLTLVPSLLRTLLRAVPDLGARLPHLRLLISSGEALEPALAAAFHRQVPQATLLNLYGTTEVAGDVTAYDATLVDAAAPTVPIGRPIANTQAYVLDAAMQPVPVGVPGELYFGGAGLALGYAGQPDLTAERFVANPFDAAGTRLYRTGDLARYQPDGTLVYLGRRDQQVKLRGMRVEPGEAEAALRRLPAVRDAAVVTRPSPAGDLWLVAYVAADAAVTTNELGAALRRELPAPLVPSTIVRLDALPYLPNGKLDRSALPAPLPAGPVADDAPPSALGAQLAALWADALGQAHVGRHDNFFELGGHSLLAVDLLARVSEAVGHRVPVGLIFLAPTVAALAATLTAGDGLPAGRSLVPLQPQGDRPPFFCVHPLGGGVGDYLAIVRHLDPDQPFYSLRARGLEESDHAALTIEALAANYVQEIQALQPAGPYALGGYSSGGLIAYEMARQLTAAGQPVALVALMDSYAPIVNGAGGLPPEALANLLTAFPHWLADFVVLGPEKMAARLRRKFRRARDHNKPADLKHFVDDDLSSLPAGHRAFMQAHYHALLAYRPQTYPGSVTLLRARAQSLSSVLDPNKGWSALALGGVEVHEVAGSHHTLLSEPAVSELAAALQAELDRAQA